jgi:amidophosphoribosyltransferase
MHQSIMLETRFITPDISQDNRLMPTFSDKPKEECAVFGVFNAVDSAAHCVLGLHALQHRGQEASGIVSTDGNQFYQRLAFGRVGDQFSSDTVMANLKGSSAIGHNRYSTSGSKHSYSNIQPIFAELNCGGVALAHNGNLTNALSIRDGLVDQGCIFRTSMDSEVVLHLIAVSKKRSFQNRLIDALEQIDGAYAMVLLTADTMIGARDPMGIRPLILGSLDGAFIFASETCALDIIGAHFVKEVGPGEVVTINQAGVKSLSPFTPAHPKFCIFEFVYFSRPDSYLQSQQLYDVRKQMGRELAKGEDQGIDVVVAVPDSGVPAALGFAEEAKKPFDLGIIRNHYMGRTFIEPTDEIRHLGVKLKHNANKSVVENRSVALLDDSLVRGTTLRKVVEMVRSAGAREIHVRISSPEWIASCFYGIDTPEQSKLLASSRHLAEMTRFLDVDSLKFLPIDGLYRALGEKSRNNDCPQYCDACFTGDYPVKPADNGLANPHILNTISTTED